MLMTDARFGESINGEIADPHSSTEVLTCLTVPTRAEVDATVAKAIAAGGKEWRPVFEAGPMYGGSFQDPD